MTEDRKAALVWLLGLRMTLSDTFDDLSLLYDNEVTDLARRQELFVLKNEAEARVNTIVRTITEFKNKFISVNPPSAEQIAETQRLATGLEKENLADLKLRAGLKLLTDVAKLLQGALKA